MDVIRLKNSCVCGNTAPYAHCCGAFAQPEVAAVSPRAAFRHDLHDLYMYLFPHRNLYQAYWERLSQEEYPHHLLMADADYGRAVIANFFWDYSVQFSDARPILRSARDVEEKDVRLGNDFRQWSLAPLWVWRVLERDATHAHVRMADADKTVRVEHGGEVPLAGTLFAGRLLPHRGRMHVHPAVLEFPRGNEETALGKLKTIARNLGVRSGNGLRPDVQCDEWRRHGALVLALWREQVYDAFVGVPSRTLSPPQSFRLPATGDVARQLRAGGAEPQDAQRFELRHRALVLARLEIEPGSVLVTLLDEAYRRHVLHWLADHVGTRVQPTVVASGAEAELPDAGDWAAWAQTPHPALGGETPLEAASHDFGRMRLLRVLGTLELGEDARSALRRHLGLGEA